MVVSDVGEQWSPNIPPPKTAASIKGTGKLKLTAKGKAIAVIIANVPQLVPVLKAIRPAKPKINAGARLWGKKSPASRAKKLAVPNSRHKALSANAIINNKARLHMPAIPLRVRSIISLRLNMFCALYKISAQHNAAPTAYKTALEPDPVAMAALILAHDHMFAGALISRPV